MRVADPKVMVTGERRRTLMRELGWRGLCPPAFRELDRELLLDDMLARKPGLRPETTADGDPFTMLVQTPVLKAVTRWTTDPNRSHALVLVGDFGEGKSLAMGVAVLHWLRALGDGTPMLVNEVSLIRSLNHRSRNRPRGEVQAPSPVSAALGVEATSAPLLAIDESGTKADLGPWEIEVYQRWLAERYAKMGRYTIVSANPRGSDGPPEQVVMTRIGAHVWDRWGDQGSPVARLGPRPMRLRGDPRIRAAFERYRSELRTAYQDPEQAPVDGKRVAALFSQVTARLKRRADEARAERKRAEYERRVSDGQDDSIRDVARARDGAHAAAG